MTQSRFEVVSAFGVGVGEESEKSAAELFESSAGSSPSGQPRAVVLVSEEPSGIAAAGVPAPGTPR
jgi:hypothetical protein